MLTLLLESTSYKRYAGVGRTQANPGCASPMMGMMADNGQKDTLWVYREWRAALFLHQHTHLKLLALYTLQIFPMRFETLPITY